MRLPILAVLASLASLPAAAQESALQPPVQVRLTSLGTPARLTIQGSELRMSDPSGQVTEIAGSELAVAAEATLVRAGAVKATRIRVQGGPLKVTVGKT